MELKQIVARIAKLQTLARGTSNVNESRAAAAKAAALIQEYRISQAELETHIDAEGTTPDVVVGQMTLATRGRRAVWAEVLLGAFCKLYNCAYFISQSRVGEHGEGQKRTTNYIGVGCEEDLKLCQYMYSFVANEAERLAPFYTRGKGVKYGVEWYEGFARGVASQLIRQHKENSDNIAVTESGSAALTVFDRRNKAVESHMKELRLRSARGLNPQGGDGVHDGFRVGAKLPISPGLNQGKTSEDKLLG
jgi:hypothetical protein